MFSASSRFERDPPRVVTMLLLWLALTVRDSQNPLLPFRAERTLTCIFGSVFC
jgi:hypothetical protein